MTKLVLDVDGVMLDFGKKYLECAREVLKYEINPNINRYELKDLLQVNESENQKVWDAFNEKDCWRSIPPLPGVQKAIEQINRLGLDVYIVSSVNSSVEASRLACLKDLGLVPKEIYCVGDGNSHKHDIVTQINPFAFVDDRLDHLFRSQNVPHLAWVNNNHNQPMEKFEGVSVEVVSLNEWVTLHLPQLVQDMKNTNRKIKLR